MSVRFVTVFRKRIVPSIFESRASPTCCPVTRGRGRKRKSVCVRAVVSLSAPCRNALKLPGGFVGGRFQRHREGERKPNVETNTNLHEERKEDMGLTSPQSPASSVCLCFCFLQSPNQRNRPRHSGQKARAVGVGAWPTRTTQPVTHRMGGADTSLRL